MVCELGDESVREGTRDLSLRELYGRVDETLYGVIGYASQLLYWQRTSNFCPVCGHVPQPEQGTWGKKCPNCGHVAYPHVTPAILALVHDDDGHMLLTHKHGWGKRFSCVAGFVEPGESLEECVQREVREELGVEVADVTYTGSQSWPFPHQLMVGYTARYVGGELHIQEQELDDARWFSVENPPEMPPSVSLSYTIIHTWIENHTKNIS
jgi:NAD+ diphosphatase